MDADEIRAKQQTVISERISMARTWSKGWHDHILEWRRLYNFEHYSTKPNEGETQFADPTYTNTVDLAVGIFQSNRMRWNIIGWEPSTNELSDTSDVEKYLTAALDDSCDVNEYDIIYETYLQFARDGGSVLYTVWDKSKAKKIKVRETTANGEVINKEYFTEIPIRTEVLDPMAVLVLPGGPKRWLCVVHCREMSLYEAEKLAGGQIESMAHLSFTEKLATPVELQDYWESVLKSEVDEEETKPFVETAATESEELDEEVIIRHAVLINGIMIKQIEEAKGYSDLPFVIGLYKPTSRNDTKMWHSIISPLTPTITLFERGVNRRQRMIDFFSSLPLVSKTANGRTIQVDPGIGKVVNLTLDESLQLPQWAGEAPDVQKQLDLLQSKIQQSGFPEMMYGSGSDVESGYALSQLSDQGRIRLNQPVGHLQQMWSWWAKKVIDLTLEFGGGRDIQVFGAVRGTTFKKYLSIDDLSGYKIVCEIDPDYPNEQTRQHSMATQAKGTLSDRTLMERYYKIPQPDDEFQRKLMELSASNPFVIQYEILRQLQDRAVAGDKVAEMAMKAVMAQMGPALSGQTTGSQANAPAGLTGSSSQNGDIIPSSPAGKEAPAIAERASTAVPQPGGGIK